MAEKITRTWKIDVDIADLVDECSGKAHVPKGDLVQLGAYIAVNLAPSERQEMFELMDQRKIIKLSIKK